MREVWLGISKGAWNLKPATRPGLVSRSNLTPGTNYACPWCWGKEHENVAEEGWVFDLWGTHFYYGDGSQNPGRYCWYSTTPEKCALRCSWNSHQYHYNLLLVVVCCLLCCSQARPLLVNHHFFCGLKSHHIKARSCWLNPMFDGEIAALHCYRHHFRWLNPTVGQISNPLLRLAGGMFPPSSLRDRCRRCGKLHRGAENCKRVLSVEVTQLWTTAIFNG